MIGGRVANSGLGLQRGAKALAKRTILAACSGLNHSFGSIDQRGAGILMYHRVVDAVSGVAPPTWNVPPSALRQQLAGLLDRGFIPCSMRELLADRGRLADSSRKVFAVTFDDGHESVFTNAWPILKELQIPATVFVATAYLDLQTPFPFDDWPAAGLDAAPIETWRPMTVAQCLAMASDGLIELGAHTHTHRDFTQRPDEFERDLAINIEFLQDKLGVANPAFAFPFGFYTPAMMEVARRAGLPCALTTVVSPVDPASSPFGWGRFHVEPWDTGGTLASKLNGWYSWLPMLRRRWSAKREPRMAAMEVMT